ncbi:MAG: flavodoxin family protein [Candidatus Hodarchaeota archaeon]
MKKVIVLYDSIYGNTKKVAMLLTRGLEAGNVYVDCISIQNFDIRDINKYDVIGIGVSSHLYGISKQLRLLLSKFKCYNLEGKLGFVFEIKTRKAISHSAAKRIKRSLIKKKVKLIHPIITFKVHNKSLLEDSNSRAMEQIGLTLSDKLNNGLLQS